MSYTLVKGGLARSFPSIAEQFPNLEAWSVGFDRQWRLLEELQSRLVGATSAYPPYNIKQLSEESYEIEMAVAGFTRQDLRIELNNNQLLIEGAKQSSDEDSENGYLYKGIAGRKFRQSFALADHVKVLGSELKDGVLKINLQREIPEERKPRLIEIE